MKKLVPFILLILALLIMSFSVESCDKIGERSEVDSSLVRKIIINGYICRPYVSVWDSSIVRYYDGGGDLIWLSPVGKVRRKIFIRRLQQLEHHGINPERLGLGCIVQTEKKLCSSEMNDSFKRNFYSARMEFLLTRAFLRYICGLNYGFINPAPIYNNLYEDLSAYSDTMPLPSHRKKKMFRLFDAPLRIPTSEYAINFLDLLKDDALYTFVKAQPSTLYYRKLQNELQRVKRNKKKSDCVRVNLERARWKYRQSFGEKYIFVNSAICMLKAVDEIKDTLFEMKVCCGSVKHKSPILASSLSYFELNPNWVVPSKIIRKEMIPAFLRDSNYFVRNKMRIYDREGRLLDSRHINWAKCLRGGIPYKVKQDSGDGSDLGRVIFRFPNRFSVYLHDTSSRYTFNYENREVSHGCIRLERPLDLVYFVLNYPKGEKMDCIRLSVGEGARTDAGKALKKNEMYKGRRFYRFKSIPLFIDYRTLYLAADGSLIYCNDYYGYDKPLLAALKNLKF